MGDTVKVVVVVAAVPAPFNKIVCVAPATFRLLSVATSLPLSGPSASGVKLIEPVQDAPAASVAALEPVVSCGQVEPAPIVKPAVMLGLLPLPGTAKVRLALPALIIATVCGLSALVEPTGVVAKVRLGGSA